MTPNPKSHRFALLTSLSTFFLLFAGAMVTSTGSGLAVPDWPLSFGQFFPAMVGGVFYEHGHRMIAGVVALMTFFLAFRLWRREGRIWVQFLGFAAVLMVVVQALLGGMTVLLGLPPQVSASHACLGQLFFCVTVILALVTSPLWHRQWEGVGHDPALSWGAALLFVGFFIQLAIGAMMRHTGAGLAIPDFPLSYGHWIPPHWNGPVAIHFAHRVGALLLATLTLAWSGWALLRYGYHAGLRTIALTLLVAVAVQVTLGASVIWLGRPVGITSIHLAVGAFCLATTVVATVVSFRLQSETFLSPVSAGRRAGFA